MVYEKYSDGKPQQTKNEFVAEALKYAHNKGIEPKNLLMDSKYSSSNILNQVESFGRKYYTQLPCNRGFNNQQ
jgi:ribonuclease HI